jgi:hypothetical protein
MTNDPANIPPQDAANYVRDMAEELVGIARAAQLHAVADALARAREAAAAASEAFDLAS